MTVSGLYIWVCLWVSFVCYDGTVQTQIATQIRNEWNNCARIEILWINELSMRKKRKEIFPKSGLSLLNIKTNKTEQKTNHESQMSIDC